MYFALTIDTEEDNWGDYERSNYTVENLRRIPALQNALAERGVKPTYLISYPVATSSLAVSTLGRYQELGQCEVGTHPHPWNTPPLEEQRTPFNSYINNLPADLQYRKIETLHSVIRSNFGVAPTTYRSGRWGFSDDVARNLIHLGYSVDTSITPVLDWREYNGPDYRLATAEPYVLRQSGKGDLLEVPATIDFVQTPRTLASYLHRTIRAQLPFGERVSGILNRLGLLNLVCLTPELFSTNDLLRLMRTLVARGTRVINMYFHSPSLLEGCTPYVRTPGELTDLLGRVHKVLDFAQARGMRFVTMSELRAEALAVSQTRLLTPPKKGME
jgi:hypothetical protein